MSLLQQATKNARNKRLTKGSTTPITSSIRSSRRNKASPAVSATVESESPLPSQLSITPPPPPPPPATSPPEPVVTVPADLDGDEALELDDSDMDVDEIRKSEEKDKENENPDQGVVGMEIEDEKEEAGKEEEEKTAEEEEEEEEEEEKEKEVTPTISLPVQKNVEKRKRSRGVGQSKENIRKGKTMPAQRRLPDSISRIKTKKTKIMKPTKSQNPLKQQASKRKYKRKEGTRSRQEMKMDYAIRREMKKAENPKTPAIPIAVMKRCVREVMHNCSGTVNRMESRAFDAIREFVESQIVTGFQEAVAIQNLCKRKSLSVPHFRIGLKLAGLE